MTELTNREKLVAVYGFTKYYSYESVPVDFIVLFVEKCLEKNTNLKSINLKKEINGLDNFLIFTIEFTIQNYEKSILYQRVIINEPIPYTIGEYLNEHPKEALIFVYAVGKGISEASRENKITFDFENYVKKFDKWVFYESFSETEFKEIPKNTELILNSVIEDIKKKSEVKK